MHRVALLVVVVAGCLQPDLVECGDLACPAGSVCVDGRCSVDRCGDGVVDAIEVCDDGNTISGDGCRQDCRSDETCGNGVLDLGESCDCGDSTDSLALGCATPNSDDVTAQCDLACSRRCGDAVVTGSEQCDGTTVPVSCAQLGYYEGAPSCTAYCALDTATCSGRCGDHIVQADHGEDCDGARPTSGSCVTYGRDYGILRCGSFCAPDIAASCSYFGWRTLFGNQIELVDLAGNRRGAIAIERGSNDILVNWDGVITRRANPGWSTVVANGPHLIGLGDGSYGWYDGAWHDATISLGSDLAAATTSTGLIYVLAPGCKVYEISEANGTKTLLPLPPASDCRTPVTVTDQLYLTSTDHGTVRWNGVAWVDVDPLPLAEIRRGAGAHLIGKDGVQFYDIDISLTPATRTVIPNLSAQVFDVAIDVDGTLVAAPDASEPVAIVDGVVGSTDSLHDNAHRVTRSEDGSVIAFGFGAYRFEPQQLRATGAFPNGFAMSELAALDGGGLAYCGSEIGWLGTPTGSGSRVSPVTNEGCLQLIGDPRQTHFVRASTRLFRWTVGTGYVEQFPAQTVSQISGDPVLPFARIGRDIYARRTGVWATVPLPADCDPYNLVGIAGAVYAFASCTSPSSAFAILRWDGAGFVKLAITTQMFYEGTVLRDGTVTIGDRLLDGTALVAMPASGAAFGASKAEYFIAPALGGSVAHVEGTVVSEITAPTTTVNTIAAASDHALFVWDPSARTILYIPRSRIRLPTSGL